MLISDQIIKEIQESFEIFKKTGQDVFELKGFRGISVFFQKKPKELLFPFGEMEGVKIYFGSE